MFTKDTEKLLDKLHMQMQVRVEATVRINLRNLQRKHTPRHRVEFADVMGMVSIKVGKHDMTIGPDRVLAALQPFVELLDWYIDMADTYRLCAKEFTLEPVR